MEPHFWLRNSPALRIDNEDQYLGRVSWVQNKLKSFGGLINNGQKIRVFTWPLNHNRFGVKVLGLELPRPPAFKGGPRIPPPTHNLTNLVNWLAALLMISLLRWLAGKLSVHAANTFLRWLQEKGNRISIFDSEHFNLMIFITNAIFNFYVLIRIIIDA